MFILYNASLSVQHIFAPKYGYDLQTSVSQRSRLLVVLINYVRIPHDPSVYYKIQTKVHD